MESPIPIEDAAMVAASMAGAGASVLANRSNDTWLRKACEGTIGAMVGIFIGPVAADAAGSANNHVRVAIAFAVAAVGAGLLTMWIDAVKSDTFKTWFANLIKSGTTKPPIP